MLQLRKTPHHFALFVAASSYCLGVTVENPLGGLQGWEPSPPSYEPFASPDLQGDKQLKEALRLLQSGDVDSAVKLVQRFLEAHFDSAPANELMGIALAKQGKLDESIERFQRALEIHPRQSSAMTKLGDVYLAQRNADLAKVQFYRAIAVDPADRRAHQRLGLIYQDEGDIGQAIEHFEKGLIGTPAVYIGIKTDLAGLYNQAREFEKSVRLLEPVATEACTSVGAHLHLGMARSALGNKELAAQSFARARKLQPDVAGGHLSVGIACRQIGDLDTSRAELELALKAKPEWPAANYQMAETLVALHRVTEAMTFFSKALTGVPTSRLIRNRMGEVLAGEKKLSEAIAVYEMMRKDGVADLRSLNGLSTALQLSGKYPEAGELLKEASQKYPDNPDAHYRLGLHYALVREYESALKALDRARELSGTDARIAKAISLAELRRGNLDRAIAEARRVLELVPDHVGEQFYIATLLEQKNLDPEAAQLYEKILRQSPSHVGALNNLALLRLRQDRADESVELARKAALLASESPSIMDTYGWVLCQKGELTESRKMLEAAVAKAPENPTYRYHLSVACRGLGQQDEALKHLEAALRAMLPFPEKEAAEKLAAELRPNSSR